jgi:2-(1,2-epoxy-1,2-dihydrophenyl)acetyl-CoA isomerase
LAYAKVGLTPDGSSTWYLPRLIGMRRALEMALMGRELSAAEAVDWGLINEAVPDAEMDTRINQIAKELCDGPTAAFAGAKRLLRESLGESLETQMTHEMETICRALSGPEATSGMSAFLAKRKPNCRG